MSVTIYHNPKCGTSRNVLAMIRQSGEEPVVIEYLKDPPSRERLEELIAAMGIPVRALLREKGTPYAELGLGDPNWTDEQLIDFMLRYPILINRPIVVTPKGVRLCRPSETVLDILPGVAPSPRSRGEGLGLLHALVGQRLQERHQRVDVLVAETRLLAGPAVVGDFLGIDVLLVRARKIVELVGFSGLELRIPVLRIRVAGRVEGDGVAQGREGAVVVVGAHDRDIAQGRNLELRRRASRP